MNIVKRNSAEKILMRNMELALLASGDGTEVIHHKLYKGARLAMIPEEGWSAMENLYVLSGSIIAQTPNGEETLSAGDSFSASPITEHIIFTAETEVEILYITSQPQFHYYSNLINNFMDLAVSVETKDGYTAEHCNRIKELSMLVGEKMGLSSDELYILNLASFLHDIGKIKVPDDILNKPSGLTVKEYEIMKQHTTWGKETLEATNHLDLIKAGEIVEQHHERFDGKGYPHQLKGNDIRIEAAIITVVDAFDAMTSDRVYRKGMSYEDAFSELKKHTGTMFNPFVVETFLSIKSEL